MSDALPAFQTLSIADQVAESGPTVAIESSTASPQSAATAAAEHCSDFGIGDIQDISFPHLENHEFFPLTAPVKEPVANEAQASQDEEAVSSKTAKNRAKKAKQKLRDKAKKEAAATAGERATGGTAEAAIVVPDVVSDEASTPGPVNESPASPEEAPGPLTKNQAKKARKKAKRAAAAAVEAEENDLLDKMKDDSKLPTLPQVVKGPGRPVSNVCWTMGYMPSMCRA